ncbi:NAD(P)-dependent oxidoreductase [Streptomyces sp. NPDC048751]|uniref:NAD(P)-dependent oxidoreductase n=1 Tax=Streptomyces sp. NPDC048751 TaxID=3365591 RepID=UPI0037210B44
MNRIVVFGAAGKAGSRVVVEAAGRGHQVTAIARDVDALTALPEGVRAIAGDVTDPRTVAAVADDADALVLTVGGPDPALYTDAVATAAAAVRALGPAGPRVIHMGGGASGDDGEARISYEDYAAALVDEIDEPRHLNRRFTVGC